MTDDAVFGSVSGHGFIATGNMTTLVDLPGYTATTILGLNASGDVGYGQATDAQGSTYFVDNNGVLTALVPGEIPVGVDNNGDVLIDVASGADNTGTSFLLNHGMVTPVDLPGYDVEATAISPAGLVAGVFNGADDTRYFVEASGRAAIFDYPDWQTISNLPPSAVNDAGEVGVSGYGEGYAAIVQGGVVQAMYYDPHGFPSFVAINAEGDGLLVDGYHNALLTPGGNFTSFEVPFDASLVTVTGLNDAGVIVGDGYPDGADGIGFTAEVPCFADATLIAAEAGQIAVEDVREGDLVRNASGRLRSVVWVGRRRVDLLSHPHPERARPVVIRADAFGAGRPARDLRVSPDHAIAFADVLIPAKCLVNGTSVVVDARATGVTYHHVELETHDLLLAEGLAVESYLDTGNRGSLMPGADKPADFASSIDENWFHWEARGCRRLVLVGPELDRARAHLGVRAARLAVLGRRGRVPALT